MANTKISALTALTSLSSDDLLYLVADAAGTPVGRKALVSDWLTILKTLLFDSMSVQILTGSSGDYTKPSGLQCALVIAQAPGGNGASTAGNQVSGGGGGGGCAIKLYAAADLASVVSWVIGSSTTFSGLTADIGSNSSLSNTNTLIGTAGDGGGGGTASGGDINMPGGDGNAGVKYSASLGQGGRGGDSFLGNGGRGGSDGEGGANGKDYGGGGGGVHDGASTSRTGGTGGSGVIYVVEFK